MSRRFLLLLVLCGWVLAACAPRAADHEQVSRERRAVANFSHVTAENSPKHQAATRFADSARRLTGGRVEIQVYPNSQLYKDQEELAALGEGAVQFLAVTASKLASVDRRWQIFDLPYLFGSFEDVERLFASEAVAPMRAELAARGLIPLAIWPNGFKQFTNRARPLVTPADFEGLTFRVQAGEVLHDQFGAVGAKAVVSTYRDLYSEIEHATVHGQENTLSNIYTLNLQQVQPYLTISDHGYLSYVVLTQVAWWHSLAPEVRDALQAALLETTEWSRENALTMNTNALQKIEASGQVAVRTLSQAEREALAEAFRPAYKAVSSRLGDPFMQQVIAAVRNPAR